MKMNYFLTITTTITTTNTTITTTWLDSRDITILHVLCTPHLVVWLGRGGGHQSVPAVEDAGERLTQSSGLQGDAGRQQEDLLCRNPAEPGCSSVSEDSAGVPAAAFLTEVNLAPGTELAAVTRPVGIHSHPVPGPELPGCHLANLHDRPGELVAQRHLLLSTDRELALEVRSGQVRSGHHYQGSG